MWRFYLIGFVSLLFFDTFGQISFKYTALYAAPLEMSLDWVLRVFSTGWLYSTFISYAGAFCTWMVLLKRAPIGPAFAISHMQVVTVMLMSVILFDDHFTLTRVIGALLIIMGIFVLALAEKRIHTPQS